MPDEIGDMKSKESYAAYECDGYIYLVAAMGRQRGRGYDIDIEKVCMGEDDDEYTIKAVVDTDELLPAPMSPRQSPIRTVVKFKSFDRIEK